MVVHPNLHRPAINLNSMKQNGQGAWLSLLPYLVLGIIIFSFNSSLDVPYFLRGYLTLLEVQVGLLALYFLLRKFRTLQKDSH